MYKSHDTYLNDDIESQHPCTSHIELNNLKLYEDSPPQTTGSDHRSESDRTSDNRSSNTADAENKHIPRSPVPTTENSKNFTRMRRMHHMPEEIEKHYGVRPSKEGEKVVWCFDKKHALWLARAIERGCIKDRGVRKTVEKIEAAEIIPNDQSEETRLFRYYLNEAKEKNDAVFLLRAYTLDCFFYRHLNIYMATGNAKKVYKKLCHKWSGYYTGVLMRNPALKDYHYRGITYRGMLITHEDVEIYEIGALFVNKAFLSTSKSYEVAMRFSMPLNPSTSKISVIIIYEIRNRTSALDIGHLSIFPEEEEVLMMPGCLFQVMSINTDRISTDADRITTTIYVKQISNV
ncbi:unnamed protein product [Adineta steineri]|uniref:NAD(P)(+)--arginine ADP-ribosyltransferase n=1 Tax=Adineta steineri TaxID=433720 RepID=A0A819RHM2_9BILA|nr:unnamed protein product [Adineta steineri]CAF4047881.1 unnamed protein product [Adineta steineri]